MILRYAFEKLFKAREAANRKRQESLRPGADDGFDPYEKPFLDHLEDLRKTLAKVLITLLVATVLTFAFNVQIFEFVQLPAKIAKTDDGKSLWELIDFLTLSPPEILMLSIKTAFIAAIILSFPLIVWFIGEFILPGLKQAEKRYIVPGVGVGFLLFLIGASFAFFVAVPVALEFFYEFYLDRVGVIKSGAAASAQHQFVSVQILPTETDPAATVPAPGDAKPALAPLVSTLPAGVAELDPAMKASIRHYLNNLLVVEKGSKLGYYYDPVQDKIILSNDSVKMVNYRIGEYISFVTRLVLVFGISFQLPIVVVILVKLQLLTGRVMRNTRSYAIVVILIAAAILTPTPDMVTLSLLAGPLIVLYEICIWIAWGIDRAREKARLAEERERQDRYALLLEKAPEELSEDEKAEIHRKEIEQYEREHAHLYHEDASHIPHDPYGHPIDGNHDASWQQDHHYDADHHYDHGHDPFHSDYHRDDPHDEPVQDWPDDPHAHGPTESDHVAGKDIETHEEKPAPDPYDEVCAPSGPVVYLNSATEEALQSLPGVGPALAKRLIEHRPYQSFDDLTKVPGITDNKLYAMIDRLSIDDPEAEDDYPAEDSAPLQPRDP
jgi:Tat protein translocase TatC